MSHSGAGLLQQGAMSRSRPEEEELVNTDTGKIYMYVHIHIYSIFKIYLYRMYISVLMAMWQK